MVARFQASNPPPASPSFLWGLDWSDQLPSSSPLYYPHPWASFFPRIPLIRDHFPPNALIGWALSLLLAIGLLIALSRAISTQRPHRVGFPLSCRAAVLGPPKNNFHPTPRGERSLLSCRVIILHLPLLHQQLHLHLEGRFPLSFSLPLYISLIEQLYCRNHLRAPRASSFYTDSIESSKKQLILQKFWPRASHCGRVRHAGFDMSGSGKAEFLLLLLFVCR